MFCCLFSNIFTAALGAVSRLLYFSYFDGTKGMISQQKFIFREAME